ncbi:hypothetical protein [Pseudodesulfovibrio piezophilus]|uniref:hypothetical protein n=1 Tax=Pseudodesulfovibrio piezophilus TaxID=879567 RepID=UPI00034A7B9E|nr:hypothetical protein [Pseudodesulfovibrio piezophilus]
MEEYYMESEPYSESERKECGALSCHCAVCFTPIEDISSAASSLAGRYYCQQCWAGFRHEPLSRGQEKFA